MDAADECHFYTVPELADRSGIGVKALRAAIRRGDLRASYPGERRGWARVRWSDLEEWLTWTEELRAPQAAADPDAEQTRRLREILR